MTLLACSVTTARLGSPRLDLKSSTVQYFNNLEKDSEYSRWPNTLMTLMQPTQRGTLHRIARNIYHAVVVGRPSEVGFRALVLQAHEQYSQLQPVRFGLLMVTPAGIKALDNREREFTSAGYVKTGGHLARAWRDLHSTSHVWPQTMLTFSRA